MNYSAPPMRKRMRWIKVEVNEPVTITTKDYFTLSSSFTSYLVRIHTNHWAFSLPCSEVRRRYSEFCWLQTKLQYHHPNKVVPPLPPKRYFHMTKFDPKLIEERRAGLNLFLQRILRSNVFLSDAALHLFLQSNLTTAEIDAKLSEETQSVFPRTNNLKYLHRSVSSSSANSESEEGVTGGMLSPVQIHDDASSTHDSSDVEIDPIEFDLY